MSKILNDLILQFNNSKANLTENSEISEIKAVKDLKVKLRELEKSENIKLSFDSEGYAELPGNDGKIDLTDMTVLNNDGGSEKMVSKFQILNKDTLSKVYENKDNLDLGNYVRGALTGSWTGAEKERSVYAALSTSTGTVLIPQSLSAEVLAAVMNKSLIYRSGVQVVDMPTGNLKIAKVVNNPTYGFKAELAAVTAQDATFEGVDLKGKMVYGLMKVSLETLHSAANLTEVLKQAMSDSIADAIDKAMLYGVSPTDIKGIFNYSTINTVEATAINYTPFVNAVGKIREKNGEPLTIGVNAKTDTALNLLVDGAGNPLVIPKVVENLDRKISNNLRANLGTGLDESEAIVFDPKALIIGNQVQFQFETSRELGFEDGSVYLRIYSLLDMALVRPECVTRVTKLK